jgi:hypothetical protein
VDVIEHDEFSYRGKVVIIKESKGYLLSDSGFIPDAVPRALIILKGAMQGMPGMYGRSPC